MEPQFQSKGCEQLKKNKNIKLISISILVLTTTLISPSFAAKVIPGEKCTKQGKTQLYKGKTYTCIKLGKKLYWNNGETKKTEPSKPQRSPSPSPSNTASQESFTFFYRHTKTNGGGPDDELTKVTIDSNNRVLRTNILLKAGLQTLHDFTNGFLLFSAGDSGNFYLIGQDGEQRILGFKKKSGIPSDSRDIWLDARFNDSLDEILFWDFDKDLYSITNPQSVNPTWTRLINGQKLEEKFAAQGLDKSKEWLDDFVVLSKNRLLLATSNNSSNIVNLWTVDIASTDSFQIRKFSDFRFMDWSSTLEMAISPDKNRVAFKYSASEISPKYRISLIDTKTLQLTKIDNKRYYEGYIGPLTFVGNDNLLLIPALTWNSDPNGGRVICRLDLRTSNSCANIPAVAGLDVRGIS